MGYRYFNYLLYRRYEGQAILRRNQVFLFLFGNTANTTRVAARRDSYRHLPTPEEQVARRWAGVVERTMGVLSHNTIIGKRGPFLTHQPLQGVSIESVWMPLAGIIGSQCRYIQAAIHTGYSTVAEERQRFGIRHFFIRRQEGARIPDRQQSSSGPPARSGNHLSLARSRLSNSQAIRHHRERGSLRQRNKIGGFQRLTAKSQCMQARLVLYLPILSTVNHIWDRHYNPYYPSVVVWQRSIDEWHIVEHPPADD